MASVSQPQSTVPGGGLLSGLSKDTVIAVGSVIMFVVVSKMYNIFLAKEEDYFTDIEIAKMAILGVIACLLTRVGVVALFQSPIDTTAVVAPHLAKPSSDATLPSMQSSRPRLERVVRDVTRLSRE